MSRTRLYVWGSILLLIFSIISYCFEYSMPRTYTTSLAITWFFLVDMGLLVVAIVCRKAWCS